MAVPCIKKGHQHHANRFIIENLAMVEDFWEDLDSDGKTKYEII